MNLDNYEDKIWRVNNVKQDINYLIPHKHDEIIQSSGTAFVIDTYKLATCYHVIENAVNIEIFKSGDVDNPIKVNVISIFPDLDFAILEIIEKDKFKFKNIIQIETNYDNYKKQDKIYSIGFPLGNKDIQLTEGIISGFEPGNNMVITTIPLNPGNSGGPIFNKNGVLIGQAQQKVSEVEVEGVSFFQKISLIVNRYYNNNYELVSNQKILYSPLLGFSYYELYNNYLINNNVSLDVTGIIIKNIYFFSIFKDKLKPCDILISIDNFKITNSGIVKKNNGEKIYIKFLLYNYKIGDNLKIEYIRDNKLEKSNIIVGESNLPINYIYYPLDKPKYEFIAGLIIQPINLNIIDIILEKTPHLNIIENLVLLKQKKYSNNELLIITYIFPGSIASNYKVMSIGNIISKINDVKVTNFEEFKLNLPTNNKFIKLESLDDKILLISKSEILEKDKNISQSYNFNLTSSYDIIKKN